MTEIEDLENRFEKLKEFILNYMEVNEQDKDRLKVI